MKKSSQTQAVKTAKTQAAAVVSNDFTNEIKALNALIDNYAKQGEKGGAVLPEYKGQSTHNKKDARSLLNQCLKALKLFENTPDKQMEVFKAYEKKIFHKLSPEGEAERRAKWDKIPSFQKRKAENEAKKQAKILAKLGLN